MSNNILVIFTPTTRSEMLVKEKVEDEKNISLLN